MIAHRRSAPGALASALCALAAVFLSIALVPAGTANAASSTYYVSATGNDTNAGTSSEAPWRTLGKVNSTSFQPGDTIRFHAGDSWVGQLWPKGSGADGAPIVIDRYGDGAKPKLVGQGAVGEVVRLFNQEYWEIRNLDVSNAKPATGTPGANLGDFRGIGVHGDNGRTLRHFVVDSVDVHDVTGEVKWIGGDPANNSPGVTWKTGWDRSKNTGGIVFTTTVPNIAAPGNPTVLTGITVQNSTIKNTSFAGVTVKQYTGDAPGAVRTGWGTRRTADDVLFKPHTNVTIRGNYITQANTAFGGNGVYLTNVRDGLVERNVIDRVGVSGIETYYADRVTVQHNEVMGTHHAQGSADANGLDPDVGTTNQLFQYNYLHDNGDGILLCGCGTPKFGSAVIRYNVVTGSKRWNLHMWQEAGTVASIYNNTFYSTDAPDMVSGNNSGRATLTNNLFVSGRSASFLQQSSLTYSNNGYSSNLTTRPSSDSRRVVGDPKFVNPAVSGPHGDENGPRLDTAANFALQNGSVFVDAGATVTGSGGRDFAGTPVPSGSRPDIGAFERGGAAPGISFEESFDGLATSPLANGTNGWRVVSTGNEVRVVDTPSATDKSIRLNRTTDGGGTDGTNLARIFDTPLQGTVTIEAQVMRNDTQAGWFGLPYVYNSSGIQAVSVAFARGEILAYEGGTSRVIGTYASGQWYRITLTVDTVNQRFDLDIDGRRVLTDAAFRTSMPGIGKIAWYANAAERGAVHVDDVRISGGPAATN